MSKRPAVIGAVSLSSILALVTGIMQVDRWLMERRQMKAQMAHDRAVHRCVMDGGVWFRGDCVAQEDVRSVVHQP